ncbi:tetratricopeptide repeat protein [uncultured Desulfobacter sp.]|uniref:tetratricopeptide repeat protein n=1 Tax=uncultured Desulfobacter sp. TaxID=240139 RepID=UPI0029C7D700|nr:tetratricopeptide repeat protein [uncultured Desulfobacter sp.]
MKTKLFILVCICAVMTVSCTSTVQTQKQNKIAQAIKKEGDVFQVQGNHTAALNKLLEAEKMAPDDPYIQNSLGLAYMGKERDDMAIQAFNKALALKPDYTEALNNLGAAYLRDEKWDIAIKTFNKVLEDITYPTPHYPLANIGWAQLAQNNYPAAQKYFLKAVREVPGFIPAIHGLAQLYIRTGQADRAIAYLNKNIRKSPGTVIFHADLAQAYEACGRIPKAIKAWQMVTQLASENSNLYHEAEQRLFELQ